MFKKKHCWLSSVRITSDLLKENLIHDLILNCMLSIPKCPWLRMSVVSYFFQFEQLLGLPCTPGNIKQATVQVSWVG